MTDILNMVVLGLIAGMISLFWTRIIKSNMIFRRFGKWLSIRNNRHLIDHSTDSLLIKFIRCCFCLTPWLVFLLSLFYIIEYTPYWIYAIIGVLGALGSGNLVCEIVYCLRNEAE